MDPTLLLFRDDAYRQECEARVLEATPDGVVLDRTVFYARGGGQPGDAGRLAWDGDGEAEVVDAAYAPDRPPDGAVVRHVLAPGATPPPVGAVVRAALDWPRRLARMRVHTALHLLSVVLPHPVTGGAIGDGEGRLDFDIPDAGLDREAITAELAALVARDAPVTTRWITDAELDADPGLVKTLTVKPPRGTGRVRLVAIEGIDLQPCGGTHVARTGEVGAVTVTAIEKKGRQNRRVRLALDPGGRVLADG